MDFLYADLNEIVDPFTYTVLKTDGTVKMDIDNNKRTLSAKVMHTPGLLIINNGKDEVVLFDGALNKTVQIPEYKIVRVEPDNGDIRSQYSLMKWDFSLGLYVEVEGDPIYLEELIDELNIENGSISGADSKKTGLGNSSLSSVKYKHLGVDESVPLMESPNGINVGEGLNLNIVGLKTGKEVYGGTDAGVQSLAFGGLPYGLSQQATIYVNNGVDSFWYDIVSEQPLIVRNVVVDNIYDITEDIVDGKYNSTITLPIDGDMKFVILRDGGKVTNISPFNVLKRSSIETKVIRGNDRCPTAKGNQAMSMGGGTLADHNWSLAFGLGTTTSRPGQMVVGMYNADEPDALFIVGNGYYDALSGTEHRSNAAAIMRDGSIKTYNSSAALQSAIAEKASKEELQGVVGYIPTKTSELTNDSGYVKDLSNYYNKTQINDLVDSSHMVNITDLSERYTPDTLPTGTASDNGKRVLVKESDGLYYYSYESSLKTWKKGYKIKGSTLYLNLADSCMYRYTNNDKTLPYPNFIKMTISPAAVENKFEIVASSIDDVASSIDGKIAALVNSAPETLDTLGELAKALDNNENIVKVLNEAIAKKANASEVAAELANKADKTALKKVATSGSYNDLEDKPGVETWTFTLDDGITKVTKRVYVG